MALGDKGTKRCGLCGATKPLTEFHRRGSWWQAWCKICRRKYDSDYHARTRERRMFLKRKRITDHVAWMRQLKSRPCVDCGGRFHPAAMSFDHLPGTVKLLDIATLVRSGRIKMAKAELAKCELVCANCHAIRTFERRQAQAA
jgi:hypothetical protein